MGSLGINEGINSSVVLFNDGEILFAAQEERYTKVKEYCGFPFNAIKAAIEIAANKNIKIETIILSNLSSPSCSRFGKGIRNNYYSKEVQGGAIYRFKKLKNTIGYLFKPLIKKIKGENEINLWINEKYMVLLFEA